MINEHPKAIAAREATAQNRAIREVEKAKREYGVRFLTVGKYTICYRVDRRDVLELSTTIRHPNDRFDKHVGQMQALSRFASNNRIHLKSLQNFSPKEYLKLAFSLLQ